MPLLDDIQARHARKRAEARSIASAREYLGMPTPRTLTPQAVYHWNLDDQINALVEAREREPDTGFMMRLLALCILPRTNPGARDRYVRRNGPFSLIMIAGGGALLVIELDGGRGRILNPPPPPRTGNLPAGAAGA